MLFKRLAISLSLAISAVAQGTYYFNSSSSEVSSESTSLSSSSESWIFSPTSSSSQVVTSSSSSSTSTSATATYAKPTFQVKIPTSYAPWSAVIVDGKLHGNFYLASSDYYLDGKIVAVDPADVSGSSYSAEYDGDVAKGQSFYLQLNGQGTGSGPYTTTGTISIIVGSSKLAKRNIITIKYTYSVDNDSVTTSSFETVTEEVTSTITAISTSTSSTEDASSVALSTFDNAAGLFSLDKSALIGAVVGAFAFF